jgi:hypothetical protein
LLLNHSALINEKIFKKYKYKNIEKKNIEVGIVMLYVHGNIFGANNKARHINLN